MAFTEQAAGNRLSPGAKLGHTNGLGALLSGFAATLLTAPTPVAGAFLLPIMRLLFVKV